MNAMKLLGVIAVLMVCVSDVEAGILGTSGNAEAGGDYGLFDPNVYMDEDSDSVSGFSPMQLAVSAEATSSSLQSQWRQDADAFVFTAQVHAASATIGDGSALSCAYGRSRFYLSAATVVTIAGQAQGTGSVAPQPPSGVADATVILGEINGSYSSPLIKWESNTSIDFSAELPVGNYYVSYTSRSAMDWWSYASGSASADVLLTVPATTRTAFLYEDRNANGAYDGNDRPLEGLDVQFSNGAESASDATISDGHAFGAMFPTSVDAWHACPTVPAEWLMTTSHEPTTAWSGTDVAQYGYIVPEPSTLSLLAMLSMFGIRRSRSLSRVDV